MYPISNSELYAECMMIMCDLRPKFDITKHKWRDESIVHSYTYSAIDVVSLIIIPPQNVMELDKSDAIALAKHFELTQEDIEQ